MAGPLNGISAQQQLPISNTFQPGGQSSDAAVRHQEAQPQQGQVRPQRPERPPPTESQNVETNSQDILQSQIAQALSASEDGEISEQPRGSVIDIEV